MLELPKFSFDSLFKQDATTISREPGWLKKARDVSGYADRVDQIDALAGAMAAKSDAELRAVTDDLRARGARAARRPQLCSLAFERTTPVVQRCKSERTTQQSSLREDDANSPAICKSERTTPAMQK